MRLLQLLQLIRVEWATKLTFIAKRGVSWRNEGDLHRENVFEVRWRWSLLCADANYRERGFS